MATVAMNAAEHFDPSKGWVEAGVLLANRVIEALDSSSTSTVIIDFSGLRGAGSTYFNTLLRRIGEWLGPQSLETRLSYMTASQPQKIVFQQSLKAVQSALQKRAS